ncbi:M57 family metalloprotease [Aquimarina sp. 2201CG14-23]|uniref:M57 family metalloprotease n=1 Tax=Aquimarina mycalae TaxID=3040073 RepID=UPI002477FCF5|nr:M57 family metalloprotease [Aquimarina sp. 2201CG14-23]MDH7447301.1 M57 family metalloprotease [Aquimarina sp. 2201CG14-23]
MKSNFLKIGTVAVATLLFATTSCSDEGIEAGLETGEEINASHLPKNVLNKVLELKMNPNEFEVEELVHLDGTVSEVIVTSGDMAMDKERFLGIPASTEGFAKQYRTEFIIDTNLHPEVNLFVYTGGPILVDGEPRLIGFSAGAQQGIIDALENWNSVRSGLTLKAEFSSNPNLFDENVHETFIAVNLTLPGFSGRAGFPDEAGNPGSFFIISPIANQAAPNVPDAIEHLITHELGHAIGLRHTDWNSRQSCVDLGLEDAPSVETNAPDRIFGTLPSIPGIIEQEDSIMNACFGETDGELNFFDEFAIRNLYRRSFSYYNY